MFLTLEHLTKIFPGRDGGMAVRAVDQVSLEINRGEFVTLLGPSGCGKTTTLRLIAGFEFPTEGQIVLDGDEINDLPPNQRDMAMVFQSYAIFPHLSVFDNIAYGLKIKRLSRAAVRDKVTQVLAMTELTGLENRAPNQLSGGQQQRVALARALVNRPQVLLLDEPLGALDLKLRKAMQLELKQIQAEVGITFIYVTHDQEEALTMSDRIAVMDMGQVQQVGAPRDIYEHPTNRFVADFIGETNFVAATVTELGPPVRVQAGDAILQGIADGRQLRPGQAVTLTIRPEKIGLAPAGAVAATTDGPSNHVPGWIQEAIYIGTDTRYRVRLGETAVVFVRIQNYGSRYDQQFAVDDEVTVSWAVDNAQILTE